MKKSPPSVRAFFRCAGGLGWGLSSHRGPQYSAVNIAAERLRTDFVEKLDHHTVLRQVSPGLAAVVVLDIFQCFIHCYVVQSHNWGGLPRPSGPLENSCFNWNIL